MIQQHFQDCFFYEDPETCKIPVIYKRERMDFGDKAAATSLELSHHKYIVKACIIAISIYILSQIRYSDNVLSSFKTQEEMYAVKEDIIQAYKKYNMELKYIKTASKYKEKPNDDDGEEVLLGMKYNPKEDTISPNINLSIYAKKRGKPQGPGIEEEQPKITDITRLTLSRLLPQAYDRANFLLGPIILGLKIYLSRVCELISYNNHEEPIVQKDEELATKIHNFICNLKIRNILPFQRAWVPESYTMEGLIISRDGSSAGFGVLAHCISSNEGGNVSSKICWGKSRIGKRSTFSHEASSVTLSVEVLKEILEAIEYDHVNEELKFHSVGDSVTVSYLYNPTIYIKDTLTSGNVQKTKDILMNLSIKYQKSIFTLGWIAGKENPSDLNSKLFADPIEKINSTLYRNGPKKYKDWNEI